MLSQDKSKNEPCDRDHVAHKAKIFYYLTFHRKSADPAVAFLTRVMGNFRRMQQYSRGEAKIEMLNIACLPKGQFNSNINNFKHHFYIKTNMKILWSRMLILHNFQKWKTLKKFISCLSGQHCFPLLPPRPNPSYLTKMLVYVPPFKRKLGWKSSEMLFLYKVEVYVPENGE